MVEQSDATADGASAAAEEKTASAAEEGDADAAGKRFCKEVG